MSQIPELTRKELYDMNTAQLIKLHGDITSLQNKIKAELICRGDY